MIATRAAMLIEPPASETLMHSVQADAISVPAAVAEQFGQQVVMVWLLLRMSFQYHTTPAAPVNHTNPATNPISAPKTQIQAQ